MRMLVLPPVPVWILTGLLAAGCGSRSVNSRATSPPTGCLDFYTAAALSWHIQILDEPPRPVTCFSSLTPVSSGMVRLTLPPGRHRCRITFLNRAVVEPGEVEAEVREGMVT